MSEHERFEELASLAAIGELEPEEQEELLRHRETCLTCAQIVAETRSVATAAFLAGSSKSEDPAVEAVRHSRLRDNIARHLPVSVPILVVQRYKRLAAVGIAAAFVLGAGVGVVVLHQGRGAAATTRPVEVASTTTLQVPVPSAPDQTDEFHLRVALAELRTESDRAREEVRALRDTLVKSDHHTAELETKLDQVEKESHKQAQEVIQARDELGTATVELAQAKDSVTASQATIQSLQSELANREARLTEVTASVEREREMLSAGREIRDIMGARDLHIVDVVDRDGKGRPRKAFGRAFYTQGKSLIFYAFDLPTKSTADGKFVYAAWGSNSNNLNGKAAHSLGIFYNDDQTQHRWAMKFDDPKLLEEIDTVFVTLEPAGRSFTTPTGRPILEAYFGTPPNHP